MKRQSLLAGIMLLAPMTASLCAQDKAGPNDNKAPEGFTLLFNGRDLANWQGAIDFGKREKMSPGDREKAQKAANDKVIDHWKVIDGILFYDGKGVSLGTAKDYGDFEMLIDWKIDEKGDSGIYLRGQPQVQIWDSDNSPGAKGEDKSSGSGGLWNNPAKSKGKIPLKKADKKPGEWNTFRILMKGDNVTVHLNGELVVDDAPLANYFEKGKPLPAIGPIELQHHNDKLWFKNIYIKELTSEKK